jgi:signal transduction histidine kinase
MPEQTIIQSTEEMLTSAVTKLARRNDALEEFAALVAHEIKAPLQAAIATDDPVPLVRHVLDLVDALLEVARDRPEIGISSPAACLDAALEDIGPERFVTTASLPARLPLPPTVLRLLLANLLRNADAGGARSVHVSVKQRSATWLLEVEDDGVGLDSDARYRRGSGLGLRLCRRIASRYGGSIVLAPGPSGGTRAMVEVGSAA